MRDLISNIQVKRALSPVSVADNTAQVSQIIDRQGFDSLSFLILIGAVADADTTFAVLVEEGDASNLSDAAAVADADLISQLYGTAPETAAGFQFDDDNEVRKIGYRGTKRYVRLTITPANNASAALLAAVALLGHPEHAPVIQATA
jgi:L-rhamnose isomerase